MILHVGMNNPVDINASEVEQNLLKLKEFVNGNIPDCKIVISRPLKRIDKTKATKASKLNTDMLNNKNIARKHFGEKFLFLNQPGLNKFAANLIPGIKGQEMNHFTLIICKCRYAHLDINYNSQISTTESFSNIFMGNSVNFKANNNSSSRFKLYTYITVSGNINWNCENFDLEPLFKI